MVRFEGERTKRRAISFFCAQTPIGETKRTAFSLEIPSG